MTAEQREAYRAAAAAMVYPTSPYSEAFVVAFDGAIEAREAAMTATRGEAAGLWEVAAKCKAEAHALLRRHRKHRRDHP